MEPNVVGQEQVSWKEIEGRLVSENISFYLKPLDVKFNNHSGMGVVAGLSFTFLLGYDGTAQLTVMQPEDEEQEWAVERLILAISEIEEKNINRFPTFSRIIPSLESAMKFLPSTREQLPLPKPNLKTRMPSQKTIHYEWGSSDCAGRIDWLKNYFPDIEELVV